MAWRTRKRGTKKQRGLKFKKGRTNTRARSISYSKGLRVGDVVEVEDGFLAGYKGRILQIAPNMDPPIEVETLDGKGSGWHYAKQLKKIK
jgi:hypothetical protein